MGPKKAKSDYTRALDLVSRVLALRDHSRHELFVKLSRRFESEVVEKVLADVDAQGLIAAPELIAARAASSWQNKMKSRRYIEGALLKRQLPVPPRDDEREIEIVRELIARKFGDVTELSLEERQQASRFLKYRGFDDRTIRTVIHAKS